MRIITKAEYEKDKQVILSLIKEGVVFIYPTDTIYGIGCDATDPEAVQRLRKIKQRYDKPFSVIVPSKQWIKDNCVITEEAEQWIEKLPGAYTLILKLKNRNAICREINPYDDTLGVRIPKHWIQEIVQMIKAPLVTTSANVLGKDFMTSIEDLDEELEMKADFMLYEGPKKARPSQIIDLSKGKAKITKR